MALRTQIVADQDDGGCVRFQEERTHQGVPRKLHPIGKGICKVEEGHLDFSLLRRPEPAETAFVAPAVEYRGCQNLATIWQNGFLIIPLIKTGF